MRLVRFGAVGNEKPGVIDDRGAYLDLSARFDDWDLKFFAQSGLERLAEILDGNAASLPLIPASERKAAPIARPGKIICIGLNYSDHAEESGMPIPSEPIV